MKTSTRCVQLGRGDDTHGAIVPPIYQTAPLNNPRRLILASTITRAVEIRHARWSNSSSPISKTLVTRVHSQAEWRR
jgi:hypothetical protein